MSILLFLFLFVIAIILLGLSLVSSILRAIFGLFGIRRRPASAKQEQGRTQATQNSQNAPEEGGKKKKKLIQKDEGEYVDFEEV